MCVGPVNFVTSLAMNARSGAADGIKAKSEVPGEYKTMLFTTVFIRSLHSSTSMYDGPPDCLICAASFDYSSSARNQLPSGFKLRDEAVNIPVSPFSSPMVILIISWRNSSISFRSSALASNSIFSQLIFAISVFRLIEWAVNNSRFAFFLKSLLSLSKNTNSLTEI